MKLRIDTPDSFKVLASTRDMVENLKFITINEAKLNEAAKKF